MMRLGLIPLGALSLVCLPVGLAYAEAPGDSEPAPYLVAASEESADVEMDEDDVDIQFETSTRDDGGMWDRNFTFSPKVGWASQGESDSSFFVPHRSSLVVQLDMDFGNGNGLGFNLAPYFANQDPSDGSDRLQAFGISTGPEYRWHFGRLHPSVGIGGKAAFLSSSNIDTGVDLYGRIPIGLTYYVVDNLALTAEASGGYGWTGINTPGLASGYDWGRGYYVDVLGGLRFP